MKTCDLPAFFAAKNIRPTAYAIQDEGSGECYVIRKHVADWQVYYAERTAKNDLLTFSDEAEACDAFVRYVLDDTTTRLG